jgi:hypothetical protein
MDRWMDGCLGFGFGQDSVPITMSSCYELCGPRAIVLHLAFEGSTGPRSNQDRGYRSIKKVKVVDGWFLA